MDTTTIPLKDKDTLQMRAAWNVAYLELLGTGIVASMNYERILSDNMNIRIGVGFIQQVMMNIFIGKTYKFEAGFGLAFNGIIPETIKLDFIGKKVFPIIAVAYRYQSYNSGFFFKVSPIILYYGEELTFHRASSGIQWNWWIPGLSFGVTF